jgi:hypothetical protein
VSNNHRYGWGWVYFEEAKGWRITALKKTIKTIFNRSAVHVWDLRHPPIWLFDTHVACQCPFNGEIKFWKQLVAEWTVPLGLQQQKNSQEEFYNTAYIITQFTLTRSMNL